MPRRRGGKKRTQATPPAPRTPSSTSPRARATCSARRAAAARARRRRARREIGPLGAVRALLRGAEHVEGSIADELPRQGARLLRGGTWPTKSPTPRRAPGGGGRGAAVAYESLPGGAASKALPQRYDRRAASHAPLVRVAWRSSTARSRPDGSQPALDGVERTA